MSRLEIRPRQWLGQLAVLSLHGRCTSAMAPTLRAALDAELDKRPRGILLDGSMLEEVEGDCLYEIMLTDRQLKARLGALAIYSLSDLVIASMRQAKLLDDLPVYPDFAAARRGVEKRIREARHAAAAGCILSTGRASFSRGRPLRRRQGLRLASALARILS